ncbi:protease-associated domain-containing protein 1-like [Stylophora pistillata]|uniref:protease-associated domain-containing protein 1-like n=1 Tax=Stylophora pistillata TaxID=50429 RepID=UPI000C051B6D|nr:protease-associated domain-containing protein 1-like [Stylophora pistillata]
MVQCEVRRAISCYILALVFFVWDYSSAEGPRVRLFSVTDLMLFDSNDLLYFEILRPKNISYIYKVKPAKNFGAKFVLEIGTVNLVAADPIDFFFFFDNGETLWGSIALVERGGCSFVSKTKTVEHHGAFFFFFSDNLQTDTVIVEITRYHIKRGIEEAGMEAAVISIPLNITTSPHLYTRQPPWSYW